MIDRSITIFEITGEPVDEVIAECISLVDAENIAEAMSKNWTYRKYKIIEIQNIVEKGVSYFRRIVYESGKKILDENDIAETK